jgi:NAD(P)H-hydrate epimerase
MVSTDRPASSLVLVLCGPGNNGGDGLVAARCLAERGIASEVVLLSGSGEPSTPDAARNWDRLDDFARVHRVSTARDSDVALYLNGIERAGLVIDALLGTGVSGTLREPVRTAVDVAVRARDVGVPVLAVDTPTAVDLTTGQPSDPVVRADVTITFHRPKEGLGARIARLLAGRVLVAPIGIPLEADRV